MATKPSTNDATKQFKYITVIAGYVLFALLVVGVLSTTVMPWVMQDYPSSYESSVAFLLAMIAGALLPVIIAYFVGDSGVRAKGTLQHHFNGMLFVVLAYMVSTLTSALGSWLALLWAGNTTPAMSALLVFGLPVVATTIVTVALAVAYSRQGQGQSRGRGREKTRVVSLLTYSPYQVLLVSALTVIAVILPLASWMVSSITSGDPMSDGFGLISFAILALLISGTYAAVSWKSPLAAHASRWVRLSVVAIIIVLLAIAVYATTQLIPSSLLMTATGETLQTVVLVASLLFAGYYIIAARRSATLTR